MKSLERECRWEGASQVALVVKNLPANAGDIRDVGLIPGSGRSPREWNANPPQYSCLENPMDSGAWQSTQSIGSQRDGHDWSNLACRHIDGKMAQDWIFKGHLDVWEGATEAGRQITAVNKQMSEIGWDLREGSIARWSKWFHWLMLLRD